LRFAQKHGQTALPPIPPEWALVQGWMRKTIDCKNR
jgi:hypothetical protein